MGRSVLARNSIAPAAQASAAVITSGSDEITTTRGRQGRSRQHGGQLEPVTVREAEVDQRRLRPELVRGGDRGGDAPDAGDDRHPELGDQAGPATTSRKPGSSSTTSTETGIAAIVPAARRGGGSASWTVLARQHV